MDRKLWPTVLSFVLVLTLLACAAQPAMAQAPSPRPVLAEAPPPPGDDGGTALQAPVSNQSIPNKEQQAEEKNEVVPLEVSAPAAAPAASPAPLDFSQWAPPPMIPTGGVAQASLAAFISDEQMLDSGGVLRAQGETLAALADPGAIACPSGKVPEIYGGSSNTGCTPYYNLNATVNNPIQLAHDNPLTKTGWWIWVSQNYLNSGAVSDTILTKSVTVKGDPLGTTVTRSIALDYSSITLRDLVVQDGQISSTGRSGTLRLLGVSATATLFDEYAIEITAHKGSIFVANVTASSPNGGARLDATGGTGTVTVLNSAFNQNPRHNGLVVEARNAVRVENISAMYNGVLAGEYGTGLWITYRTRLTLKNLHVEYSNLHGIFVEDTHPTTPGPVTLQNIYASDDGTGVGIHLGKTGPISGSNLTISGNAGIGLRIYNARGSISLSGVTAAGNARSGIRIESNSGSVSISNSRITGNQEGGVVIISKSTVTFKNSIVYKNTGGVGLNINNSSAPTPLGVTLTNLNVAENTGYGIQVTSKGTATLSGVNARANGYAGAYVQTTGGTTVSSSYGSNSFNENGTSAFCVATPGTTCSGLYIDAAGTVSVSSTSANGNAWLGMGLYNARSTRVSSSTANNNDQVGVFVNSKGSISLDRVTAMHNESWIGIYLSNAASATNSSMTLNHVTADHNGVGVEVYSRGPVTINHINASYNAGSGIIVDNYLMGAGLGAVTLTNSLGTDLVYYNLNNNLTVLTKSSVSIRGLNASRSSTGSGAVITNTNSTSSGVSISSSEFNGNGNETTDSGLKVASNGTISLNTVTANSNSGRGADLQNQGATLTGKTVSISKGTFSDNTTDGLLIYSKSSVTLNNVSANANDDYGVFINNYQGGAGTGNVTISSSLGRNQFSNNDNNGLFIQTQGNISISNSTANGNGLSLARSGIAISSYGTGKTATFTCVSAAENGTYGINLQVPLGDMSLTLKGVWLGKNPSGGLNYFGTVTFVTTSCQ